MKKSLAGRLKVLMSVPRDNPRLLKAQFVALSRQLPMMYLILLVNTLALAATHYATAPRWLVIDCPLVLTLVGGWRALMWLRIRRELPPPEKILSTLIRTNRLSGPIAVGFTVWSLALYPYGDVYTQNHVAFYMAITVIVCIFCLMHLRPAALTTAAVVNIAFVAFFASTHNPIFIAMAVNVFLVTAAMLFVLQNHYRDFTRLVNMQASSERLSNENQRLANQDSLTGLPNRRQFFSVLDAQLDLATSGNTRLAVGLIDLDGFKPVNDIYGHRVGDTLLVQVGRRLQSFVTDEVHLARLGGDEFGLIMSGPISDDGLRRLCNSVCDAIREPFPIGDIQIQISASLGVVIFPEMATSSVEVYEYADYALYQSKKVTPGSMCLFSSVHYQQLNRDVLTEQGLRRANIVEEFAVVFQPIIDIRAQRTVAFEALARWVSPELGNVAPCHFIAVAERIGLVSRLTLPLLEKALAAARTWPQDVRLSFNLSAHDCGSEEAVQLIMAVVRRSQFDPRRLDFEITETAVIQDIVQTQRAISLFRQLGCGISLDDFGTGYSSLSQIHALSLTKLKIDRSFITNIHQDPASYKIVKSLLALSQDMELECITEGVETDEELQALKTLGCTLVQGYLFSEPLAVDKVAGWLQRDPHVRVRDAS
jgi:diguanylate cyclase (GGDEF)-like protein